MDDAAIASRVISSVTSTPGMEHSQLTAVSYNGAVQLQGTVRDSNQWLLAAKSAREVAGVRQVTNSLRIAS
jgi:osmotically-inducible protein OsmY